MGSPLQSHPKRNDGFNGRDWLYTLKSCHQSSVESEAKQPGRTKVRIAESMPRDASLSIKSSQTERNVSMDNSGSVPNAREGNTALQHEGFVCDCKERALILRFSDYEEPQIDPILASAAKGHFDLHEPQIDPILASTAKGHFDLYNPQIDPILASAAKGHFDLHQPQIDPILASAAKGHFDLHQPQIDLILASAAKVLHFHVNRRAGDRR
uniref:Catalase n=1 Tax=Panagrellus redivivus TaxID=6233 RepID=A0A7E4VZ53_PANRE